MFKDKDKQREADKARQQRRRDRIKAEGVINRGMINRYTKQKALLSEGVTDEPSNVIPKMIQDVAANGGEYSFTTVKGNVQDVHHTKPKLGKDIKYQMTVMECLFYRPASKLKSGETNFVSLPGRTCYGVV